MCETQLSGHRLVELLLGHNPLSPKQTSTEVVDKNPFRAVNYHNAEFEAMNELLATIDWNEL